MKRTTKPIGSTPKRSRSSALTPESRVNEMIARAYDLVDERLQNGTATSQETVHFLKLGSEKARLEAIKLQKEIELMEAKAEAIKSAERAEAKYAEAIKAFRSYNGQSEKDE